MLPAQRNKIDISKLTPEQQTAFRLYGRLPSTLSPSALLKKAPAARQYFDSGDYALSKSGRSPDNVVLGTEHPTPSDIPHPAPGQVQSPGLHAISTSPSALAPGGMAGTDSVPGTGLGGGVERGSPPALGLSQSVGVAGLPSPATRASSSTSATATEPTAPVSGSDPIDIGGARRDSLGGGGGGEHGTPVLSPPPPSSPIKASSLGSEVMSAEDVEMESEGAGGVGKREEEEREKEEADDGDGDVSKALAEEMLKGEEGMEH